MSREFDLAKELGISDSKVVDSLAERLRGKRYQREIVCLIRKELLKRHTELLKKIFRGKE